MGLTLEALESLPVLEMPFYTLPISITLSAPTATRLRYIL
jgi:hypothetical protein